MKRENITQVIGDCYTIELKNDKKISVNCYAKATRTGFKHYTNFIVIEDADGYIYPLDKIGVKEIKCCYINRTWERYKYQSLLYAVIERLYQAKFITIDECVNAKKEIE